LGSGFWGAGFGERVFRRSFLEQVFKLTEEARVDRGTISIPNVTHHGLCKTFRGFLFQDTKDCCLEVDVFVVEENTDACDSEGWVLLESFEERREGFLVASSALFTTFEMVADCNDSAFSKVHELWTGEGVVLVGKTERAIAWIFVKVKRVDGNELCSWVVSWVGTTKGFEVVTNGVDEGIEAFVVDLPERLVDAGNEFGALFACKRVEMFSDF
jgi:hypothetical protein